jgi:L-iditol 2-dehydrogenase
MLAALIYGKEDLRLEEVPFPTPDAGEIAIKVRIATICIATARAVKTF